MAKSKFGIRFFMMAKKPKWTGQTAGQQKPSLGGKIGPPVDVDLIIDTPKDNSLVCFNFLACGEVLIPNTQVHSQLFDTNGNQVGQNGPCQTNSTTWCCFISIPQTVAVGTRLLLKIESIPPGESDQIHVIVDDCIGIGAG